MRRRILHIAPLLSLVAILVVGPVSLRSQGRNDARPAPASKLLGGTFVENRGQWDRRVAFRLEMAGHRAWVTAAGLLLDIHGENGAGHVLRHEFTGARAARIRGRRRADGQRTFIGSGSAAPIPAGAYGEVVAEELYPGIDLHYRALPGSLKYELVVAPGIDPATIRFTYRGADGISVAGDGRLRVGTSVGPLYEDRPYCYQEVDGARIAVPGRFVVDGTEVGFAVGRYDRRRPLVIDPSLAFGTYLGGSGADDGRGIAIDSRSNVYVTGLTQSDDLPTTLGAYRRVRDQAGSADLYVAKLDPTGSHLLMATYVGGAGLDEPASIAVGPDGAIFVAGTTTSADFPVSAGSFSTSLSGGSDGFLLALEPSGSALRFSTYLGGRLNDHVADMAVNFRGEAFVAGWTLSDDFPTTPQSIFPAYRGGEDAFSVRFNAAGTALTYATYLGGTADDRATGLAIEPGGAAFLTGWTSSTIGFPVTATAFQSTNRGGRDVFVAKIRTDGTVLDHSTLLGGSDHDQPADIAVESGRYAYVVGLTLSTDFPNTITVPAGTWFVTRLDLSTGALAYSRYVGPVENGSAHTVQVGAGGGGVHRGDDHEPVLPAYA